MKQKKIIAKREDSVKAKNLKVNLRGEDLRNRYKTMIKDEKPLIRFNEKELHLEFLIPFKIIPASRPQSGKFNTYIKEPYKSFKKLFNLYATNFVSDYSNHFLEEKLEMECIFFYKLEKKTSKRRLSTLHNTYRDKKPDSDNLTKSVMDALNELLYKDDAQIVSYKNTKVHITNEYEKDYTYVSLKVLKEISNPHKFERVLERFK